MTTAIMASSAAGCAADLLTRYSAGSLRPIRRRSFRLFSSAPAASTDGGLQPPDVPRLADTARISLSSQEMQEFAPKIRLFPTIFTPRFGRLQAVNLESVEPSLRVDAEVGISSRENNPESFENREAIIAAVPSYDYPYIKIPKVLNKL